MTPMPRFLSLLMLLWLAVLPALAQVRSAPEGNSLPDQSVNAAPLPAELMPRPDAVLTRAQHEAFAAQVRLAKFRRLAVFDGRAKIIDTLAREWLDRIYGKSSWKDLTAAKSPRYDPVFTYLDLIFNRSYYFDKPLIHVEVLPLRRELLAALQLTPPETEIWLHQGRLTPTMLSDHRVEQALQEMDADVVLLKGKNQLMSALFAFTSTGDQLNMVSPPAGSDQWRHLLALADRNSNNPTAQAVLRELLGLRTAWQHADAVAVNQSLDHLADLIPRLHPGSYPPAWVRELEYIYNVTEKFTLGYIAYALAALTLLIAFAVQRRWLIATGVALLTVGLAIHAAGIIVRGILAQRWPIHNQYESYIAISFFAVAVGVALMWARRQWLYGAAAAALGACALLFANTVDIPSNDIGPVAGILATSRILYVHVNMVLASYALIALGFFLSLFYLAVYYLEGRSTLRFAAAGLGATALAANPALLPGRQKLLADLDSAQMVVLQLAFWLLGVGIMLGAYWADHAWGRFWGWDPKETWALITWIVYLIVIHMRFGVARRGLVTAWLSVLGFFVMLWTYWGVNLLLAGLHSYA